MNTENYDDYSFCRNYLTPGETILWRGKPGKGHLLTAQDALMIPFSIFWCGFAVFWEITAITNGAPFFFALWGIPFVCVGLYLVFGRFIWTAYIRKHTRYVITNRKIIRLRGKRVDMMDKGSIPQMYINAFADGSGTISFGYQSRYNWNRRNMMDNQMQFTMEVVDQVARVHQIIIGMNQP